MNPTRTWCLTFGVLAILAACRDESPPANPGTGGATGGRALGPSGGSSTGATGGGGTGGLGGLATGGAAGGVPSFGSIKVGDPIAPPASATGAPSGTVTSIHVFGSYASLSISYPPAWTCPAQPNVDVPSVNPTPASDPALSSTTCNGLVGLRSAGLKSEARATALVQRNALAQKNCSATAETRCIDVQGNQVGLGNCSSSGYGYGSGGRPSGAPGAGGASASGGTSGGATSYSTTNTQVLDVDEADYVKNDANTIFVLGSDGLHVIDAWPAADTHPLTTVKLTGEPKRLFLDGTRLVVYSRESSVDVTGRAGASNPSDQGCTYGYQCRFTSDGGHTLVTVFDVSEPAKPVELIRYEMSGAYVSSRRIGHTVYTVVHDTGAPQVPGVDSVISTRSYQDLDTALAAKIKANDALIDAAAGDSFLPWVRHATPGGQPVFDSACSDALVAAGASGTSFLSVTAFDLSTLGPMTRTIVGSNPGFVYASTSALYVAVDQAPALGTASYNGSYQAASTAVHKFALSGTSTAYGGSVTLPGHILNQFAMDEKDGVLRVASTRGWVPDPSVSSFLTTFGDKAGRLGKLGEVANIAPGEDIRSVRFDGARGFVVTFKKTDPLFVFDLTDAASPKLTGELMIPGFSTYMHPLDARHLLTVGFNADDQGSFAFFNGIQIQIFDVTDLANPQLAFKKTIGTRGSSSEALTNHLAFNYFAPKKMLALPVTVCDGGGNGQYGDQLTFSGLMVFDVSLDTGISEHGRMPFVDPAKATGSCQTWWTNATSLVKRSIFMDDWLYGLSDARLQVAPLASLDQTLQSVSLVANMP